MNKSIFIQKANVIHNHKYNYNKSEYVNYHTNLIINCPKHGDFLQTPATHLRGSGCKNCPREKQTTTNTDFIKKCKIKHPNFNYSETHYVNNNTPVSIICPLHGTFITKPAYFLKNKNGCPQCYDNTQINSTQKFIKKATEIHKDRYLYENSNYINDKSPIEIICKQHGSFFQKKKNHLSGAGCSLCAKESCTMTGEEFIHKAKCLHHNKYDYSKVDYHGTFTQIEIICYRHGSFLQLPSNHLKGAGCLSCARDTSRSDLPSFIEKSNVVHLNKYDYSKSVYTVATDKITIICPIHGPFKQKANNHLQGQGCPSCPITISKPQQEISDFINLLGIKTHQNNRSALAGKEIDIYCPSHSLGIEYHGLYWHSYNSNETNEQKIKHQTKALLASKCNIKLLQIFEHEWNTKKDIVLSMIKHKLGLSKRILARECEVAFDLDVDLFLNMTHIQGYRPAKHNICLIYNNQIIATATYSKHAKQGIELIRMSTDLNHAVIGGVSKLMKHLKKRINNDTLVTHANMRYSDANGYIKAGFKLIRYTKPGYFYYHENTKQILSRQKCQKHKLESLLTTFNASISESQNMFNNNFRRVWDAGHYYLVL